MRKDSVPAAAQVVEPSKAILTEDFPGACLTLLAPSIPRGFPEVSFLLILPYVHLLYISTRSEPHWHLWRVSLYLSAPPAAWQEVVHLERIKKKTEQDKRG